MYVLIENVLHKLNLPLSVGFSLDCQLWPIFILRIGLLNRTPGFGRSLIDEKDGSFNVKYVPTAL